MTTPGTYIVPPRHAGMIDQEAASHGQTRDAFTLDRMGALYRTPAELDQEAWLEAIRPDPPGWRRPPCGFRAQLVP